MTARVLVAVSGLSAVLLPGPSLDLLGVLLTVVGLAATGAAVRAPGSDGPLVAIAAAAASWWASGSGTAALVGLTVAVSVLHAAAAFAAVVPVGAPVARDVVRAWMVRTTLTTAGGLLVVGLALLLPTGGPAVVTVLAGLAAVLVLGGAGAALLRLPARPRSDSDG